MSKHIRREIATLKKEILALGAAVEEILYPAMEDFQLDLIIGEGPAARSVKIDLAKFTLVAATTRAGLLTTPLRDRFGIVHHLDYYDVDSLEAKYGNKKALRDRLWLADGEKPIVAFIGRLDPQKGLELIRHAIFYTLEQDAQFVLLGSSPDTFINGDFWDLKHMLNESPDCHLEIGFDEDLAHLIYAGSDMLVIPSAFEPCGLTQIIAMKYGTVPVARASQPMPGQPATSASCWKAGGSCCSTRADAAARAP